MECGFIEVESMEEKTIHVTDLIRDDILMIIHPIDFFQISYSHVYLRPKKINIGLAC